MVSSPVFLSRYDALWRDRFLTRGREQGEALPAARRRLRANVARRKSVLTLEGVRILLHHLLVRSGDNETVFEIGDAKHLVHRLGLGFAAIQTWLWADLLSRGSAPQAGTNESLFFGLTCIHAGHVAVALAALLFAQVGLLTRRYGAHRLAAVQNVAIFWHFMDVVWVVLFAGIFVF